MLSRLFILHFVLLVQVENVVCQCTSIVCERNEGDSQPYILEKIKLLLTQVIEEKCTVETPREQTIKGTISIFSLYQKLLYTYSKYMC